MYWIKFNNIDTHIPQEIIHYNKSRKEEASDFVSFKKLVDEKSGI
jgi:hypothetical protein